MKTMAHYFESYLKQLKLFGIMRTLLSVLDILLNKIFFFDCLNIIILDRNHVKFPKDVDPDKLAFRFATLNDLIDLKQQSTWGVTDELLKQFKDGDRCLLVYVGSELGGYTWAHLDSKPELIPGFSIRLPDSYVYNYAGFTLPKFRGLKLHSCRHHYLVSHPLFANKQGLLGYVKYTNWAAINGLTRSGFRTIGRIYLFGRQSRYCSFIAKTIRELGIERIYPIAAKPCSEPQSDH
jgi:hypothetical protein